MTKALQRDTNTITIANFWENHLLGKYNYNPDYQRKSMWTEEKQSFFIDSILRNFPIPPIFLHQHIDTDSGKTIYDVIDGKQRLESLIHFIKNEIPVSIADPEAEKSPVAGAFFKDLDKPELLEYKRRFWRYVVPIEYIDTDSKDLIDDIFDRLNRNGEPLTGQELRHATYHSSPLLKAVRTFAETPFWKRRLISVDASRMEDTEFVSELVFALLEKGPQESDQHLLDDMYLKYANQPFDEAGIGERFKAVSAFLEQLNLDYEVLRIGGTSHLYGLWCFANFCLNNGIPPEKVAGPLNDLFRHLRDKDAAKDEGVEQYRKSMSFNTKSRAQRARRLEALKAYVLPKLSG